MEQNEKLKSIYNPEGSTLRYGQYRMLEILDYIVGLCEKHNLQYWLCGGTVLGAVRHGGFIPWDDDLDIEMPISDFCKFKKIIIAENHPHYKFHDHNCDEFYFLRFPKIRDTRSLIDEPGSRRYKMRGLFVDVFPMEKSSRWIADLSFKIYFNVFRFEGRKWYSMARLYRFMYLLIILPVLRMFSTFSNEKSLYQPLGKYRNNPRYYKDIFPLNKIIFEGKYYNCPNNIDGYLKQIFGDNYMQIPSVDKIESHSTKIEVYE